MPLLSASHLLRPHQRSMLRRRRSRSWPVDSPELQSVRLSGPYADGWDTLGSMAGAAPSSPVHAPTSLEARATLLGPVPLHCHCDHSATTVPRRLDLHFQLRPTGALVLTVRAEHFANDRVQCPKPPWARGMPKRQGL